MPRALLQSLVLLGVAHATVALNPGARYDRSRFVRVCLEDAHTQTYTHAQAHAHARKHTLTRTRTRTLVIPGVSYVFYAVVCMMVGLVSWQGALRLAFDCICARDRWCPEPHQL